MNRCFQHDDHGVLGSFVVFSTFVNHMFKQRRGRSITNQGLRNSPGLSTKLSFFIGFTILFPFFFHVLFYPFPYCSFEVEKARSFLNEF